MKRFIGKKILFVAVLLFVIFSATTYFHHSHNVGKDTEKVSSYAKKQVLLDVPLESQFTEPALGNGCEVTGYDNDNIYVNDPYGEKNRPVAIKDFEAIFTSMGGQMLTLEKS